jgi:hypothetical protein
MIGGFVKKSLKAKLHALAKAQRKTMTEIVTDILERAVSGTRRKK